jgi:hypothetical protein
MKVKVWKVYEHLGELPPRLAKIKREQEAKQRGFEESREKGKRHRTERSYGINKFFEVILAARLAHGQQAWGAWSERDQRLYLRLWRHQITPDRTRIVVFEKGKWGLNPNEKFGGNQRRSHIEDIKRGVPTFAVLCTAKEIDSRHRKIVGFDPDYLIRLGEITEDEKFEYAKIAAKIPR